MISFNHSFYSFSDSKSSVSIATFNSVGLFDSTDQTEFPLECFGINENDENKENHPPNTSNEPHSQAKINKIVDKIQVSVKQLGIMMKVHDPEKLLNVLIMQQQLNILRPVQIADSCSTTVVRTIDDILKPPEMVERTRTKNKNMKVTYGVMSANEVIKSLKEKSDAEKKALSEKEIEEISKAERLKNIEILDEKMRQDREKMKSLRAENVVINKKVSLKRKLQSQAIKCRGNELTLPTEEHSSGEESDEEPVKLVRPRRIRIKTEKM